MKKRLAIVLPTLFVFCFASVALFANAKLLKQHKEVKGAAKKIATCNDCHNTKTKLEKKKGKNFKALYKTNSCNGAGCHK